jgi:peptide/nickel transport system substrate-binding protein
VKKLLVPVAILLISAFIITGCGTSTPSPAATTTGPTTLATTQPVTTTARPATTTAPYTPTNPAPTTIAPAPIPSSAGTAKTGGMLRWVSANTPGTPIGWNPETSGGSVFTMQLALQYLLKEQIDGSLTPNLATSYDVVSDPANASLTFHLRQGVKFSDGSDFNAQAVKWAYQAVKDGNMNSASTQFWKSFDILDDYTIRVNLTTWQNRMIRSFADGVAFVESPTAYQKNGLDWMRWNMVGTGPFVQTNFQRDVSLTAAKNTNYWDKGYPYLDGVQLLYVADPLTAQALFKSGGADVIQAYSNKMASDLGTAGYKIISQPTGAAVLAPDSANADSPWSNPKVRQAAEYAIDKVGITQALGYGLTQPAYQLNSSASPAYDSALPNRTLDIAKAKQLLTDAGYPNGFKSSIIDTMTGTNHDECVAIQAGLAKIGIVCDVQFPEQAQATSYLTGSPPHNALLFNSLLQWANPNTGFNFYFGVPKSTWFPSTSRPTGWVDTVTPSLMSAKVDSTLAKKAEDALYNDATIIPLWFAVANFAVTGQVQDSYIGTRGASTWWEPAYTWLKK